MLGVIKEMNDEDGVMGGHMGGGYPVSMDGVM